MITLEQAKVGMADKVDQAIIDEFRRGSLLLDTLIFDNAVSPGTAGSTLTYGYMKLKTPSTAAFRKLNEEYKGNEAKREKATAELKIFGGEFSLDRVIINTSGAVDELDFQMKEKVAGAINLFHYTVINGDDTVNQNEFNGLNKMVTDTKTEFVQSIDLSTSALMDDNYNEFLDHISTFVSRMKGKPSMFLMNSTMLTKFKNIARRAGYYSRTEDAFGRSVDNWDGIPFVDLEEYFDDDTEQTIPCVPIHEDGTTDIYAVQIAKDGFHGVSPTGDNIITTSLPDLKAPGVIKKGDVEMVAAVVLKNTLKAGVFRGIKVAPSNVKELYTITYNANGGTGDVEPVKTKSEVTLSNGTGLTGPAGKTVFKGWAKTANAINPTITNPFTPTSDITVYAVWAAQ